MYLYCFDINTHQPVWHKNICTDFGSDPRNAPTDDSAGGFAGRGNFPIWAISQCPLIYGDLLVVLSQAPEAGAVAYKVLVVGGYELGATMIQVEKQADGSYQTKELFVTEEFGDQTKPPLFIDGYFYCCECRANKKPA